MSDDLACLCGHLDHDHYAHTGPCIGDCGCVEYVEDNGSTPGTIYPKASDDPYHGIYLGKKYTLEESA